MAAQQPSSTTSASSSQQQPQPTSPTIYFGYGSNLWLHQMRIRCPLSRYLGIARLNNYKWIINDRGYANVVEIKKDTSLSSTTHNEPGGNQTKPNHEGNGDGIDYSTVVFGLVYSLTPSDEAQLDLNEGVPIAYQKEYLDCDFWADPNIRPEQSRNLNPNLSQQQNQQQQQQRQLTPTTTFDTANPSHARSSTTTTSNNNKKIDTTLPPTTLNTPMLVYIDRHRTTPSTPREEYIYRMNRGISDALDKGVPSRYVEEVLRGYIRSDGWIGQRGGDGDGEEKEGLKEKAERQARRFEDESGVH